MHRLKIKSSHCYPQCDYTTCFNICLFLKTEIKSLYELLSTINAGDNLKTTNRCNVGTEMSIPRKKKKKKDNLIGSELDACIEPIILQIGLYLFSIASFLLLKTATKQCFHLKYGCLPA